MPNPFATIPPSLQDLLPKWAHFCLYVEHFIADDLYVDFKNKLIVVGLSGGIDSTALLLVLHYLSSRNNTRLIAAHLNHRLRDEADGDEAWCHCLCEALAVPFVSQSIEIRSMAQDSGLGLEETGRNARYAFFHEVMAKNHADYVAVGHHRDDLCEDVLMRIIRGTGWPALSGMPGFDPGRNVVRPLLMLPKSTLRAFLGYVGISWREDASNLDDTWTRNRIRADILPPILKENPNFGDSVTRLWKIGQIEMDYWNSIAEVATDFLSNAQLESAHKAVRLRMYKGCLDALGIGQALANTLFKLDTAWEEKRVGTVFQFPGEKTATVTASGVLFALAH